MRFWWITGSLAAACTWVLLVAVQAVAGDALPPDISISQYGVGPHGWLFSIWMLCVAAGPCLLYLYRPVRGFGARWWLLVGWLGAALMATVRTDPGGLQESVHAKIHLGGAVLALSGLPLGMMFMLLAASRLWRRLAIGMVAVSAAALELLLISAGGIDTTGAGIATSWSLWQSVAVAVDMLVMAVQAFGVLTIPPVRGGPEPWWTRFGGVAVRPGQTRIPDLQTGRHDRAGSAL